jgi:hypothetical protein
VSPQPSNYLPPSSGPAKPSTGGPSLPPGAKENVVTLTGTVERVDLEGGCTVLRTGGKTYELKGGDPKVLRTGAKVVVHGAIRTDIMTICQMGPVLEVLSSQPA